MITWEPAIQTCFINIQLILVLVYDQNFLGSWFLLVRFQVLVGPSQPLVRLKGLTRLSQDLLSAFLNRSYVIVTELITVVVVVGLWTTLLSGLFRIMELILKMTTHLKERKGLVLRTRYNHQTVVICIMKVLIFLALFHLLLNISVIFHCSWIAELFQLMAILMCLQIMKIYYSRLLQNNLWVLEYVVAKEHSSHMQRSARH